MIDIRRDKITRLTADLINAQMRELRYYRLECCAHGLHDFGDWVDTGRGEHESIPGRILTGRERECEHCRDIELEWRYK